MFHLIESQMEIFDLKRKESGTEHVENSVIFLLFGSQRLFLICFFVGCQASKYERALLKKLFHSNYDKNERPVVNDSDAVVVVFGLTLNQIVDVVRNSEQL